MKSLNQRCFPVCIIMLDSKHLCGSTRAALGPVWAGGVVVDDNRLPPWARQTEHHALCACRATCATVVIVWSLCTKDLSHLWAARTKKQSDKAHDSRVADVNPGVDFVEVLCGEAVEAADVRHQLIELLDGELSSVHRDLDWRRRLFGGALVFLHGASSVRSSCTRPTSLELLSVCSVAF